MRWFKHMTASANDERLMRFRDACGLEGYGFFWAVMEIIASLMDESDRNYAAYPKRVWCNKLAINHQTWSKLIARAEQLGLFVVSEEGQDIKVSSPNILKYRDEYTERLNKKSGQHRDKLPPLLTDTEADTDTEEEKEGEERAPAHVPHEQTSKPPQQPSQKPPQKTQPPQKSQFGESGNVKLTLAEHEKLSSDFTPEATAKAIQLLDDDIGSKGRDKYKSHYHAIRKWVFDAVKEREAKLARGSPQRQNSRPTLNDVVDYNAEVSRKILEKKYGHADSGNSTQAIGA